MKIIKLLSILVIVSAALLNGCASFSQNEVAQAGKMPDVSRYEKKPSVYIDLRFLHGEPGSNNAQPISSIKDKLVPVVEKSIRESQLFSEVTFDEFKKQQADYTLKIEIYNHGSAGAAAVSGFVTGFTFGIIPGVAVDNYTVKLDAYDRNGKVIERLTNRDSVKTWLGLWFIPVMGNTPEKAVSSTIDNQIKVAIKALIESGRLKYSLQQYYQSIYNA